MSAWFASERWIFVQHKCQNWLKVISEATIRLVNTRITRTSRTVTGSTDTGGETDTQGRVRPSPGLRRETGLSIAGLTVALPGGPGRAKSQSHPEEKRELVASSRPPSFRSGNKGSRFETEGSSEEETSEDVEWDGEDGREDGEGEGEEEVPDTRSIKSFESMLGRGRTKREKPSASAAPSSASVPGSSRRRTQPTDPTDRLTHGMVGMSWLVQGGDAQTASMLMGRLPLPNRRFVECAEQDIRVSEVGELLREYQRLVEAVRSAGGFHE